MSSTLQPSIHFTQGDVATLVLTAVDGDGNPVDLTDATFRSFINGPNGEVVEFPNGQHTANPDQINFRGQYALALSSDDTGACGLGNHKEILTQITIETVPVYFRGFNVLQVFPPVPVQ